MGERVGIENAFGNCVLNSIVQALFTSTKFRESILNFPYDDNHFEKHIHKSCPLCSLRNLFIQLEDKDPNVIISTEDLRRSYEALYGEFFAKGRGLNCLRALNYIFGGLHESATGYECIDFNCCDDPICPVHTLLSVWMGTKIRCFGCDSDAMTWICDSHVEVTGRGLQNLRENRSIFRNFLLQIPEPEKCTFCDSLTDFSARLYTQKILIVQVCLYQDSTIEESIHALRSVRDQSLICLRGAHGIVCCDEMQYSLFSVCCGDSRHLMCFAAENGAWKRFDDRTVVHMGTLERVLNFCKNYSRTDILEPVYLFYEAL